MSFRKARIVSGLVSVSVAAAAAIPAQAAVILSAEKNAETQSPAMDDLMVRDTVNSARASLADELYASQFRALAASEQKLAVASPTAYLNIHSDASLGSEVLGKLYSNDVVKILNDSDGKWTKVSSGSIVGYVMRDYLIEDESADVLVDLVKSDTIKVTDDDVRVYKSADSDSKTVASVSKGEQLTVKDSDTDGDYIKVSTDDGEGYISRAEAEVVSVYPTAVTAQEDAENTADASVSDLAEEAQDKADDAQELAEKAQEAADAAQKEAQQAEEDAKKVAATSTTTSKEGAGSAVSSNQDAQTASADTQKLQLAASAAKQKAQIVQTAADNARKTAENMQAAADVAQEKVKQDSAAMGQAVVDFATQYVGNPYVWGGTSLTNGIDCSGFTMQVYAHFGVSLPHYDMSQRKYGSSVSSLSEAQPGDLIFYSGHVAIYMGDGKIVHAANRRDGIKISNANYQSVACIRRIFN